MRCLSHGLLLLFVRVRALCQFAPLCSFYDSWFLVSGKKRPASRVFDDAQEPSHKKLATESKNGLCFTVLGCGIFLDRCFCVLSDPQTPIW